MKRRAAHLTRSFKYWDLARELIPVASQTFSKAHDQFVAGVTPLFVRSGNGSKLIDVDGNEYIDYILGVGPMILGYKEPLVDQAIVDQLHEGTTFSLSHPIEIDVAELICSAVPCAEMVRFAKTGSEVTSAAIRVGRAHTGRQKIACCGYHGWHDWYAVLTPLSGGIPEQFRELVHPFPYNDLDALETILEENEIAAVILEPTVFDPPAEGFLEGVRSLTRRFGAVLIFDEIWTGFRFGPGGAQEYFKVVPDLATFGKALANGMPLYALAGERELMKLHESLFISSTFGGETLSLAAARATLGIMSERPVFKHIWAQGEKLKEGFNEIARHFEVDASAVGYAPRMQIRIGGGAESSSVRTLLFQETVKNGILFHPGLVALSFAHSDEDIRKTLDVCEIAIRKIRHGLDTDTLDSLIEGEPIRDLSERGLSAR
jgi:glutamate-1-semialdehyde 2,1-aminomutase